MLSKTLYTMNLRGLGYGTSVILFQKAFGLDADNIYGPQTDTKLISVVKQVQKKVKVKQDGLYGTNTTKAVKRFQSKNQLVADGKAGPKTRAKMGIVATRPTTTTTTTNKHSLPIEKSKYFKKGEFKCECRGRYCNGYPVPINPKLVWILEELRKYYGKPITITSGIRCQRYNDSLRGSVPNSVHRLGGAADFYIPGVTTSWAGREAVKRKCYALGAKYCYHGTANMGNAVHVNV